MNLISDAHCDLNITTSASISLLVPLAQNIIEEDKSGMHKQATKLTKITRARGGSKILQSSSVVYRIIALRKGHLTQ